MNSNTTTWERTEYYQKNEIEFFEAFFELYWMDKTQNEVAEILGVSTTTLQKIFKEEMGCTLREYLKKN